MSNRVAEAYTMITGSSSSAGNNTMVAAPRQRAAHRVAEDQAGKRIGQCHDLHYQVRRHLKDDQHFRRTDRGRRSLLRRRAKPRRKTPRRSTT